MTILEIIPTAINDLTLTITEPIAIDPTTWNSATAYSIGQSVSYNNKKYTAITANTNKQPDINIVDWGYIGNINKYALLDEYLNTQTIATGNITIVVNTTNEKGIYLSNIDATSVHIVQTANGQTVINKTYGLTNPLNSWYDYFFEDFDYRNDLYIPLSLYLNSNLTITLINSIGAKIGGLFKGKPHTVAYSQWDSETGIVDYSKKLTDAYGNTYLKTGNYKKKMRLNYAVKTDKIDYLMKTIIKVRGKSAVFIGSENYDSLLAYGYFSDIQQTYNNPVMSYGSIQIEGLI